MIVRKIKEICDNIGLQSVYGNVDTINIALQNFDTTEKTLVAFLSNDKSTHIVNEFNMIIGETVTGLIYFIRDAYPDNAISNENNHDFESGEYVRTIEPMEVESLKFGQGILICERISVKQWEIVKYFNNSMFTKGVNILQISFKIDFEH
jgi:hypothetical protein